MLLYTNERQRKKMKITLKKNQLTHIYTINIFSFKKKSSGIKLLTQPQSWSGDENDEIISRVQPDHESSSTKRDKKTHSHTHWCSVVVIRLKSFSWQPTERIWKKKCCFKLIWENLLKHVRLLETVRENKHFIGGFCTWTCCWSVIYKIFLKNMHKIAKVLPSLFDWSYTKVTFYHQYQINGKEYAAGAYLVIKYTHIDTPYTRYNRTEQQEKFNRNLHEIKIVLLNIQ